MSCTSSQMRHTTLTYVFPRWCFNRSLNLELATSPGLGSQLSLKVSRICLKSSPYTAAWTIVYGGVRTAGRSELDELSRILARFPCSYSQSPEEVFNFTPLHMICIGLSSESLEETVMGSSSTIVDDEDITGRTALSWAAQKGSPKILNQLLFLGADPDQSDYSGKSPLQWALFANSALCLNPLLLAGADVSKKDQSGRTPLHEAVQGNASFIIVQVLLDFGADIRARDGQGMMPLHLAAYYDQPKIMSSLLRRGAAINDIDWTGRTALHIAISLNNYNVLRLLLGNACLQYAVRNQNARSIFHFAACLGDICTLNILAAANLTGLFADDKDSTGVTASHYAQSRRTNNEQWSNAVIEPLDEDPLMWYTAFERFVDSIKYSTAEGAVEEPADSHLGTWDSFQNFLTTLNFTEAECSVDPSENQEVRDDDDSELFLRRPHAEQPSSTSFSAAAHSLQRRTAGIGFFSAIKSGE